MLLCNVMWATYSISCLLLSLDLSWSVYPWFWENITKNCYFWNSLENKVLKDNEANLWYFKRRVTHTCCASPIYHDGKNSLLTNYLNAQGSLIRDDIWKHSIMWCWFHFSWMLGKTVSYFVKRTSYAGLVEKIC